MKMDKRWAYKWARDLETTSARQTKRVLNNGRGGFCCLGRLCVIAGERGKRIGSEISYGGETAVLPSEVMEKVGMKSDCGELPDAALTELNDEKGMTFREIAKVIRKNWKIL